MNACIQTEFNSLVKLILKSNSRQPIAIAVSGGPDSISLLHLLAVSQLLPVNSIALTIDHGFRSNSSDEAKLVASFAEKIGVRHETLLIPWSNGPFPNFPINKEKSEAPARQSRLILLNRYLAQHAIDSIWMGHHLDDQVENRLIWGKGMEIISNLPKPDCVQTTSSSFKVIRPLLNFTKSQLMATCDANSLPYCIDPSNFDPDHTPRNTLRYQINQIQSRHSNHSNHLPGSIGGPLALLYQSIRLQSLIPPVKPIEIGRRKAFTFEIIPSTIPPSTSPAILRASLKLVIDQLTPNGMNRITPSSIELIRQRLWCGNGFCPDFNPGGGVWFSCKRTKKEKEKLELIWTISRQRFRSSELKGKQELFEGDDWIEWDGRVLVRIERISKVGLDEKKKWFIEARGKYSEPVIWSELILDEATYEQIWKLSDMEDKLELGEEKSWLNDDFRIHYKPHRESEFSKLIRRREV